MSHTKSSPPPQPVWSPRDYADLRARLAEDIAAEPVVLGESPVREFIMRSEGIEL